MKNLILKYITKFPNFINYLLLKLNLNPLYIFGSKYIEYKKYLNKKVNNNNNDKLIELINYSILNVKYYKDKYHKTKISNIEDFNNIIGFIDKDILMDNPNSFISQSINKNDFTIVTTGGTSGKPLSLLVPKNRYIIELGTVHYFWDKFDFNFNVRAVLRNEKLINKDFIINPITKEIIFDGFNLTDNGFDVLYKTMFKYKIKYLQCYPSSGYAFAKYIKRLNLDISFLNSFFVSSENVLNYQKEFILSLGVKLFCLYGHSEKLVIAGTCPHSDYYHVNNEYGLLELIDKDNNLIEKEDVLGEIVGTTYNNYGMPLIRYKTGDFSEYIYTNCKCGYNGLSLKFIKGRWNGDKVFNKDGTYVTTTALNLHSDLYTYIDGIQYIQNQKGNLTINIIPNNKLSENKFNEILLHFVGIMNNDSNIILKKVINIKRHTNGKFLLLISNIKKEK